MFILILNNLYNVTAKTIPKLYKIVYLLYKFIFNNNENWFVKAVFCNVGKYSGENEDDIWHRNLEYDEVINVQ